MTEVAQDLMIGTESVIVPASRVYTGNSNYLTVSQTFTLLQSRDSSAEWYRVRLSPPLLPKEDRATIYPVSIKFESKRRGADSSSYND